MVLDITRRRGMDPDFGWATRVGRDLSRLFDEFPTMPGWINSFDHDFDDAFSSHGALTHKKTAANIVTKENDDKSVTYDFNLAGVPKEKIELTTEDNTITVKAHDSIDDDEKKATRSYSYSITVDGDVANLNSNNVKYENGILKVTVPALPEVETSNKKQIEIH
ncbi:MAG: Hsp20/alpha crystallin family protein [Candidatus Ancillula sp.]|nr:Hsp20/alpha crystallin family protein [Candidatus Ancillula sp.]